MVRILKDAYSEPGNEDERLRADNQFYADLLALPMDVRTAKVFYDGVRLGGGEWLHRDFSWGFAWR